MTTAEDIFENVSYCNSRKIKLCQKNGGEVKILTYTESENLIPLIDRLGASNKELEKFCSPSKAE